MAAKAYNYRAFLIWALSKCTEEQHLVDFLLSCLTGQVEITREGSVILSTSAHGTSITYSDLKSAGCSVEDVKEIFELLWRRCKQAAAHLGADATDQQIADLVMTALFPRNKTIMTHQHIRGNL